MSKIQLSKTINFITQIPKLNNSSTNFYKKLTKNTVRLERQLLILKPISQKIILSHIITSQKR